MENILQPWVSLSFLQDNNHQAVKKMNKLKIEHTKKLQFCCIFDFQLMNVGFAENFMKSRVAEYFP